MYKNIHFENSEQAFMWEKANYFGDTEIANEILHTPNPKENKMLGRKIKNFNAAKWLVAGYDVMVDVCYAKFDQNPSMKKQLLSTGDKIIVEASPYDVVWGIGLHWEDDAVLDEKNWRGQNLLGKALMDVREKL
jgi:ribA/ribD-fused uncharacterized protein